MPPRHTLIQQARKTNFQKILLKKDIKTQYENTSIPIQCQVGTGPLREKSGVASAGKWSKSKELDHANGLKLPPTLVG